MLCSVNHLGHFLLTSLLMPTLLATAAKLQTDTSDAWGHVRVVNVSSMLHFKTPKSGILWDNLNWDEKKGQK
jgi:NAD(P)-dependent dehydrogenase (short-subunit alcohol dehydrogenase family)